MEELDMARPGSELFPESQPTQYNSYQDVNVGQAVDDPLYSGVKQSLDAAGQEQMSHKEMNFEALRGEVAKMKEEAGYWRGQAEAFAKQHTQQQPSQEDVYSALDWEDSKDVKRAFEAIRSENDGLRNELKDAIKSLETKTQHSDWNNMVTQHVPQLTSKNPIFAEMIKNASNPYEAAYLLAELNSRASQQQSMQPSTSMNGQRAINNASKPQTLSSVGGQGQLSAADYYASMSDEDFMKVAARNLANI